MKNGATASVWLEFDPMWELWKLKNERRKTARSYSKHIEKAKQEKVPRDELESLYAEEAHFVSSIDDAINAIISDKLVSEARSYDVEMPGFEKEGLWEKDWERQRHFLSAKGRSTLRKMIDEEKSRRFEITVRWAKLIVPIITALAGLIGIITGLVAILRR